MAFNSFALSLSSKEQVGGQGESKKAGGRNKGKAMMQNYMKQYIIHCSMNLNISLENGYNKQHSPWRAMTPATDFSPLKLEIIGGILQTEDDPGYCFYAAEKCAFKMSKSTQMVAWTQRWMGEEDQEGQADRDRPRKMEGERE